MRNLAMLNQLWDGATLNIDRRTSESFTVRGARLTMALQIQEPALREFFIKSGELARGTGFLARFLVSRPTSTQGFRPFTEAPANWPALAAFNRRIAEILNQPVNIDDDGALTPAMMSLSPQAKRAWVEYHDTIESELATGGALYDIRDVASKSADNAARLAALFQVFEHGTGAVSADCFVSASRIAAWHLKESRRFFGELALPAELADAVRLDRWLADYCRRERKEVINKRYLQQHGPVRDKARLDAAISELIEHDRLISLKEGRKVDLTVNPALLIATATLATFATVKELNTVAKVATVAVANLLLAEEEAALREWLSRMGEENQEKVEAAIAKCRTDPKARMSCLEQARKIPPEPELDYTATCGA